MKPILHEYSIADNVFAFSSTRKGGVSEGNYGEFNINTFCGDSLEHTAANRQFLADELGIGADDIILPHQVHGVECRLVSKEMQAFSTEPRIKLLNNVDAVITDQLNICIGVSTADCIPVLLYDAKHHAAAAIHAGWRGTVAGIVRKCVVEMHQCFDTDPADLKAVIGPGISLERFEVGQEVYDQFAQAGFDMDRIARMYAKWHIDLPLCNQLQLQQTGIKYENIEMSGICTHTQSDEYFSARKLGINSGRIYTGIILK